MTAGSWLIGGLSPDAVESFAALSLALADLAERGLIPPCQNPHAWHRWTSEDGAEREAAAHACQTCPLLDLCTAHGRHERAGVWGTDTDGRRRKSARHDSKEN